MQLKYQCLSERCRHEPRKLLGCYQLNEWCQWKFVKESAVEVFPMATEKEVEVSPMATEKDVGVSDIRR